MHVISLQSAEVCAVCSHAALFVRCCQCEATTPSAFVAAGSLKTAWCVLGLRRAVVLTDPVGANVQSCIILVFFIRHLHLSVTQLSCSMNIAPYHE